MKTSKRLLVLGTMITGAIVGGFLFPPLLKLNFLGSAFVGALTTLLIVIILSPNLVNEINPNLSEERKKKLAKIQFHGFKRTVLHPTRLPAVIGMLWFVLFINASTSINLLVLPPLFLLGFSGFQMIYRNEYIGTEGNIIHGFPAKLYGYMVILVCWGGGIFLILASIFHW